MEYKYYRELKHNYLILENRNGDDNEDCEYQYRIAGTGRVKELLPCSIRMVNGEKYYYYEINSMQSISDRFAAKGMSCSNIRDLLGSIKDLLEDLSEFLMTDEGIVFSAKNIYIDLSSGEYRFMFCPFYDESRGFYDLCMELIELVNEDDEEAMELAYSLCEKASVKGDFVYQILEEILGDAPDEPVKEEIPAYDVEGDMPMDTETFEEDVYDEDDEVPQDDRMGRSKKRFGAKMELLFSLLFSGVLGAMVYIRMNYRLSEQENLLSIFVMLVSAVTGMVALVGGLRDIKWAGVKENEDSDGKGGADSDEPDYFGEYEEFEEAPSYSVFEERIPVKKSVRMTAPKEEAAKIEYPETVVLGEDADTEMSLFSRNLDKTVRIALGRLPITVGKMEGCVDRVLSDVSVSRMHCRFVSDGDRVALLDLGSTNGTYRNGIRLKPQEKTYIEEGDEIRIGRVCFDCR